jgi:hypothetical protein
MNKSIKTPNGYTPFLNIDLCNNQLINCQVPIEVEGNPVFLIGQGEEINIWIMRPNDEKKWGYVVTQGISEDAKFKVFRRDDYLSVYFNDFLIMGVVRKDIESIAVNHIDLRPLGLEITGNVMSLNVGGSNMTGNTFENVGTMVSIG